MQFCEGSLLHGHVGLEIHVSCRRTRVPEPSETDRVLADLEAMAAIARRQPQIRFGYGNTHGNTGVGGLGLAAWRRRK